MHHPYPIVQVRTEDGLTLHGLLSESKRPKALFVHIHGTASNFYEEDFLARMVERFADDGISFLSTNNRGAGTYDPWEGKGAAVERFEDCLLDIDAWIEFAISRGYERIILSGHSLGTEKVVYYMGNGKFRKHVAALVLLAPADSYGYQMYGADYRSSSVDETRVNALRSEAQSIIDAGKGDEFLGRTAYAGIMPKSAESYVNFLGPDTELSKALPFHKGSLEAYRQIAVPIFAAIGDQEEYTAIPPREALALMKSENSNTEIHSLEGCDHDFSGCEETITDLVADFIKQVLS